MTIGDQFKLSGCTLEEIVQDISGGEFDVGYLEEFEYRDELQECCLDAIEGLSARKFLGPVSNAKVMGNAMELLRERHHVDAPRGWYPVMKRLRGQDAHLSSDVGPRHTRTETSYKGHEFDPVQWEYERELLAWHAAGKPLEDFHAQFKPSPANEAVWQEWQVWHEDLRTFSIKALQSGELQRLERHRGFVR